MVAPPNPATGLGTSSPARILADPPPGLEVQALYGALVQGADDAIFTKRLDGTITSWNPGATRMYGYVAGEIVGRSVAVLASPDHHDEIRSILARIAAGDRIEHFETVRLHQDGSRRDVSLTISPIRNPAGEIVAASTVARDISARKNAEERLHHLAHHDPLTGLPNRTLLSDRISQAISVAPRHGKQVAVLFLDLDGFKHINDSLGHAVGDRLLQSVAARLKDQVRGSDTVSRQGGDEFIVLLSGAEDSDDAAIVAKRMIAAIGDVYRFDAQNLNITTSIGISVFPDDGDDAETLIKNADTAMYQAKQNGRNGIQSFRAEMNVRAVDRQSVEQSLRVALEREEFVLHYQPKIDLASGAVIGAEALIRWAHPIRGLVSPAQFIPIAEQSGLIVPIGRWVLREACRQMCAWRDEGLLLKHIAVNVSAVDLWDEGFLDHVLTVLAETGLDAEFLDLELTETVLMKNVDATAATLQQVRKHGVKVSLDDFGTGFSSLSHLDRFPIDTLKIDRSFVSQITLESGAPIIAGIVNLARSLKLRVVAEGVETAAQLAFLRALACDEAQGYYFSRPVPPAQFPEYVERRAPGLIVAAPQSRPRIPGIRERFGSAAH